MRARVVTLSSFLFFFGCGGDVSGVGSSDHPSVGGSDASAGATEAAATADGGSSSGVSRDPRCPSWSDLNDAAGIPNVCQNNGLICMYPEGQAECAPDGAVLKWWPIGLNSGCPEGPPKVATACTSRGGTCDYITGPPGAVSTFLTTYCCDGDDSLWELNPDGGCPNGNTCGTIRAADYDQSCSVDSDCVGVHEGDLCDANQCTNCTNAAIRSSAEAKYQADFAAKVATSVVCPCPSGPPVTCAKGVCGVGP